MTRVAAFDCGTNSLRLLVADLDAVLVHVQRDVCRADFVGHLVRERAHVITARLGVRERELHRGADRSLGFVDEAGLEVAPREDPGERDGQAGGTYLLEAVRDLPKVSRYLHVDPLGWYRPTTFYLSYYLLSPLLAWHDVIAYRVLNLLCLGILGILLGSDSRGIVRHAFMDGSSLNMRRAVGQRMAREKLFLVLEARCPVQHRREAGGLARERRG